MQDIQKITSTHITEVDNLTVDEVRQIQAILNGSDQLAIKGDTMLWHILNDVKLISYAKAGQKIVSFAMVKKPRQIHLKSNICHTFYKWLSVQEHNVNHLALELGYLHTIDRYRGIGLQKLLIQGLFDTLSLETYKTKTFIYSTIVEGNTSSIHLLTNRFGMQETACETRYSKVYPEKKILLYTKQL